MPTTLDSPTRRALRARAHHLDPVVTIGQHGLTPTVVHEVEVALRAHELIKIRVFDDDRAAREAMLATLAEAVHAAPVQHLGKLLVLWRPNPEKEAAARARTGTARNRERPAGVDDPRKRGAAAKGGGGRKTVRAGASGHGARKRGSTAAEEAALARKRRRDAADDKSPGAVGPGSRSDDRPAPPPRGRARPAPAEGDSRSTDPGAGGPRDPYTGARGSKGRPPADSTGTPRGRPAPPAGVPRAVQPRRRRARG